MKIDIYNQLSQTYNQLFMRNIDEFVKSARNNKNYTCFYPSFGLKKKEKVDFLIYGQAVKGWTPNFNTSEKLNLKDLLNEAVKFSNSSLGDTSPLEWVNVHWSKTMYNRKLKTDEERNFYSGSNDFNTKTSKTEDWQCYNMHRSFYWNVCYKLLNDYYKTDRESEDWTKKMIWSNLYKIAPSERANPNDDECRWQEEICIELVKQELEEIKPKYCIVLTNDIWWEPFRKELKTKKKPFTNNYIESVETYNGTKFIVTGRPYPTGDSDKYVEEILTII